MSEDSPGQPRPWQALSKEVPPWLRPFYAVRWVAARFAYDLRRSPFLALAKLVATFALPFGAFTYCWEAKDRHRERIYRTWEVVSKADVNNAGPARFEALQDLVENDAALAKIQLRDAWLETIDLRGADLRFADLSGAHLAESRLGCRHGNTPWKRCANLRWVNLAGADLAWGDLSDANLSRGLVEGVDFTCAKLVRADLLGLRGWESATWRGADLTNAKNVSPKLLAYASRDSFLTSTVPLPASVRSECAAGRPANDRAIDTLPMPGSVGFDAIPPRRMTDTIVMTRVDTVFVRGSRRGS